jgi:hypothetical protein
MSHFLCPFKRYFPHIYLGDTVSILLILYIKTAQKWGNPAVRKYTWSAYGVHSMMCSSEISIKSHLQMQPSFPLQKNAISAKRGSIGEV